MIFVTGALEVISLTKFYAINIIIMLFLTIISAIILYSISHALDNLLKKLSNSDIKL